ncbi:hypothetical protein E2C01_101656 [Portunus trituberculatus]|nr:hypothetical protein [Portunus trituberculatus]
MASVRR